MKLFYASCVDPSVEHQVVIIEALMEIGVILSLMMAQFDGVPY